MDGGTPVLELRPDVAAGFGHVARTFAIAQAWIDAGGRVRYVGGELPVLWRRRFEDEGIEVVEPGRPTQTSADWVVLDGYTLSPEAVAAARGAADHLLLVDDAGESGVRGSDLILDSNPDAAPAVYLSAGQDSAGSGGDVLIGAAYTPLRREFGRRGGSALGRPVPQVPWPEGWDESSTATRVLLAVGGSPDSSTSAFVERCAEQLRAESFAVARLEGREDVASLMADADLALSAAGSTAWELAASGVPSALVVLAENQQPVADALGRRGAAVVLGWLRDVEAADAVDVLVELRGASARRAAMSATAKDLVDGAGARRVVAEMRARLLELRPADGDDVRRTWEWSNDPTVRAVAFSTDPIPWDDHVRWFADALERPDRHLWIVLADGEPIGQVRFDVDPAGEVATISFALDAQHRGQGWGAPLVLAGMHRVFADGIAAEVVGEVRPGNESSRRCFDLAAFDEDPRPADGGPGVESKTGGVESPHRYRRRRSDLSGEANGREASSDG